MKEFSAQTGGRYTYVDDILNLQNLALAFSSIFSDCDNFIVSGCKINGTSIGSGYVYINGKLRHFQGASGISAWPQYIYEANSTETVAYESGADKVGRNIYGCAISPIIPAISDPLTGSAPQSIQITASGGKRIKDAFFGKYALILNPASKSQEVDGAVGFKGDVEVTGSLTSKNKVSVKQGNAAFQAYYDTSSNFIIQSQIGDGKICKLTITDGDSFVFSVNGKTSIRIGESAVIFSLPIVASDSKLGNIRVIENNIYNTGVSDDGGSIDINMSSHNGTASYFRNTNIGNGKGAVILGVNGKDAVVNINGSLIIANNKAVGLQLKGHLLRTNAAFQKYISWADSESVEIGVFGFNSATDNVFRIKNSIANIQLTGKQAVDIGPEIMEGGALLSKKYVLKDDNDKSIAKLALADKVYSIENADKTFAKISGGLSQFIDETNTKSILRGQIGSVSIEDVLKRTSDLTKHLSDMAKTDEDKKKICDNIGAAYKDSYQEKMKDTGWVEVVSGLYARQIGNVVSVQGQVTTIHSDAGTLFTLPNNIDAPKYAVCFTTFINSYAGAWKCSIDGGSKSCKVDYCNAHGNRIPFSITYMV